MGLAIDREHFEEPEYEHFVDRLRENLAALRELLQRPGFGVGAPSLGAELEVSLIDAAGEALPVNRSLLAESLDPHLQLELDRFNLEYNLTPVPAAGQPFARIQAELEHALGLLGEAAEGYGGRVVPIGILPTLREEQLQAPALTDLPRYRALASGIRRLRRKPFEVCIDGLDPLRVSCNHITLEGASTSFQLHLRVNPEDFADTFNAVQLAAPVALALGANSPVFLGHRLWDETRVALFKQAIDSRSSNSSEWRRVARVPFGHGWVRQGALELFAEAVALFPPLIPLVSDEDPVARVAAGELPSLLELRLQQGTIWQWNRAIYDPGTGGHLRIEVRALPSGPTPIDMVASGAFLIGLALGLKHQLDSLLPAFPFRYAEYNFYRAAQNGLDAELLWPTTTPLSPREVPVAELAQELLPLAEKGLADLGIDSAEINRLLDVIRERLACRMTPARWQRRALEQLEPRYSRRDALGRVLETYVANCRSGKPVAQWGEQP